MSLPGDRLYAARVDVTDAARAADIHRARRGGDEAPHDSGDDGERFACFDCGWSAVYGSSVPADRVDVAAEPA